MQLIFLILVIFLSILCFNNASYLLDLSEKSQEVRFVGRYDFSTTPRAMWPGSSFIVSLQSISSAIISLNVLFQVDTTTNYFINLLVDGKLYESYQISTTQSSITFSTAFDENDDDIHEFQFMKVTESYCGDAIGTMGILEISVDGATVKSPTAKETKFLFLGDSLTAAYGVEGSSPCSFTASTENILDGYAGLTASYFDADFHVVAWSGKGVVRNYGEPSRSSAEPMPTDYNRTFATDTLYWEPSLYEPDVVFVMLGTNDYSTVPHPTDSEFTTGLINFLSKIMSDYPTAKIIAACAPSPYHAATQCANTQSAATSVGAMYLAIDATGGYGCDSHPDIEFQSNIADVVIEAFAEVLDM